MMARALTTSDAAAEARDVSRPKESARCAWGGTTQSACRLQHSIRNRRPRYLEHRKAPWGVNLQGLRQSLLALWPSYVAFLTSFVTVLVAWVHHHWVFTLIRRIDHPFLYWNGLLLLCITSRFKRRCCPRIFSTQRRRSSRICIQGHSLQSRSPSMRCGGMPRNGCCPPVKPA